MPKPKKTDPPPAKPPAKPTAAGPSRAACVEKSLPKELILRAAADAVKINPQNRPAVPPVVHGLMSAPVEPMQIALLTSKKWGAKVDLSVSFLDNPSAACRRMILEHANAWGQNGAAGIRFRETTSRGDVRIARGGSGYWSYLGTDIRLIDPNQPTMNLQGFTERTAESEYKRVVRHEFGHTLGFPHEQQRPEVVQLLDPNGCYKWFWEHGGWNRQMVDAQILTPLVPSEIRATAPDVRSIMEYEFDASCTKNRQPIPGGDDIDVGDAEFARTIYPGERPPAPVVPPVSPPPPPPVVVPPVVPSDERGTVWQVVMHLAAYGMRLTRIADYSAYIWAQVGLGTPVKDIVANILDREKIPHG